jgi:shikimate kinase
MASPMTSIAPASSARLGPPRDRTVVLVGLMGVGKSSIGKRLAQALNLPFSDADAEIEAAAGRSIADIFAERGEAEFRDGERRVIARLLEEPPHVLATGGGAFSQSDTRALVLAKATTVWLKADLEVLARRVGRKTTRPLLIGRDPIEVLTAQAEARYPHFAQAHLTVDTGDAPHGATVDAILKALTQYAADSRA